MQDPPELLYLDLSPGCTIISPWLPSSLPSPHSRESPALLKLYSNHLGILLNSFNSPKGLNVWTLKSGICRLFLYCPIYFLYCAIPPPRNSPAICFNQGGRGMEQERKRGDSISINTSKTLLIYFRIHWLICHPYSAVNALLWMF